MSSDPISDLLTRIRNASLAKHPSVSVPCSTTKERILRLLASEGYIAGFSRTETPDKKPVLKIMLRYADDGSPVIREIRRISKPGRRLYVKKDDIPRHKGGLGMLVISTPRGMLSDLQARRERIGGELICAVF